MKDIKKFVNRKIKNLKKKKKKDWLVFEDKMAFFRGVRKKERRLWMRKYV
jgi:hypothetical protein